MADKEWAGLDQFLDERLGKKQSDDPEAASDLRQSLIEGMESDPDKAARALRYAHERGLPLDMAERNLEELEKEDVFGALDFDRIAASPTLTDFLRDRENARLAHDDLDPLMELSDFLRSGAGGAVEGVGRSMSYVGGVAERQAGRMAQENPRANLLEATAMGMLGFAGETLDFAGESYKTVAKKIKPPANRMGIFDHIAAGLGQVGTQIGVGMVGGPVAAAAFMGTQMADVGVEQAERAGKTGWTAEAVGALYGGITGLTEKYGLGLLMKGIPEPIKRHVVGKIAGAAVRLGLEPDGLVADAAIKAVDTVWRGTTEGAQEVTEGLLQSLVDKFVLGDDKALTEDLGLQAGTGFGVGAIVGAAVNLMIKGQTGLNIEMEKLVREEMKESRRLAQKPQLFARAKDRLNKLIAAETGETDIYLKPQAVATYYQKLGEEARAQLNADMPDFEQRLTEALTENSDFVLRRADYHTYVQPLDEAAALDEYVRLVPDHMSAGDRADYDAEIAALYDLTEGAQGLEEGELVRENFYSQLLQRFGARAAPSGKVDVARLLSENPQAFYETMLARSGGDARVKAILDRMIRDVQINRVIPGLGKFMQKSDFDLQIERLKNLAATPPEDAKRGRKTAGPLISFIAKSGGVKQGSRLAGELAGMGINPKSHKSLFRRTGRTSLDNLVASEFNQGVGADLGLTAEEDGNGYVAQDWLLEQIRAESFGGGPMTEAQQKQAEDDAYLEQLAEAIEMAGVDIKTASVPEIKQALERAQRAQVGLMTAMGQTFNQRDPGVIQIFDFVRGFASAEELLRAGGVPNDALDLAAFGFSEDTKKTISPDELTVVYDADLEQVKAEIAQAKSLTAWAEKIDLSEPIEVRFDGTRFVLEDGHHRYMAAKIRGEDLPAVITTAANPLPPIAAKLGISSDYDQFHRDLFDMVKNATWPLIYFQTDYSRVMPRDLFNEAKVLTMHLKFIDDYNKGLLPEGFEVALENESLSIGLTDDGDLYLEGINVQFNGEPVDLRVTYNAGKDSKYPLHATAQGLDAWVVPVYDKNGGLDEEFTSHFGKAGAAPAAKIKLPAAWQNAKTFMNQLGVIGLWDVDRALPRDFVFDLHEPDDGFLLQEREGRIFSENVAATLAGKKVEFFMDVGDGILRFKQGKTTGPVLFGSRGMSDEFKAFLKSKSKDKDVETFYQRESAPPFYSATLKAVEGLKQEKGTGEQFLAQIMKTAGVKEEEIAWIGLDVFLKGKKSVTRDEVAAYVRDNQVQIEEVTLDGERQEASVTLHEVRRVAVGDASSPDMEDVYPAERVTFADQDGNEYEIEGSVSSGIWNIVSDGLGTLRENDYESIGEAVGAIEGFIEGVLDEPGGIEPGVAKFGAYTLPGGENYREVLLTLPPKDPILKSMVIITGDNSSLEDDILLEIAEAGLESLDYGRTDEGTIEIDGFDAASYQAVKDILARYPAAKIKNESSRGAQESYRSSHFNQPNILAHVRLNDRTDADGKRVLFIEEIQSDWHQAGRKRGYKTNFNARYADMVDQLTAKYGAPNLAQAVKLATPEEKAALDEITEKAIEELDDPKRRDNVPDAPLKKTWHEMAFRRIIRMAAEQGYDRVAWTPGEVQNDRYDLSHQINVLRLFNHGDGNWDISADKKEPDARGGRLVDIASRVPGEKLADYIGKDMAEKAIKTQTERGWHDYSGLDLKIGGEGMKGFYDKILPSYAKKFAKKFGASVGTVAIEAGKFDDVAPGWDTADTSTVKQPEGSVRAWSLDITPEMRDTALREGFALFQDAGDPRGAISFLPDGRVVINLFQKENLSTVLHELGHLYWKTMTEIAALEGAPAQVVADVDALYRWVGATKGPIEVGPDGTAIVRYEPLTVEQEEKIADAFLSYLREGKAPSADMQSGFSRFAAWLNRLYRGVRDTLPKIDPEVKAVFDRMLATDEAIEAVSREPHFAIDQAIMNMLTKADAERMQKKYDKMIAEAKERLFRESMKQAERRNTQEWREARAAVREETAQAVGAMQVYRTMDAIKKAGGLSRAALIKAHGKEVIKHLSGHGGLVARKGGADPAAIAAIAGYDNARSMVVALMNAAPKKARIEADTDEEMLARFGDMMNDGTIEQEALEAFNNALRAEVLEMEVKILAELGGIPAPTKDGIKARAVEILAAKKVRDISPSKHLRAENKAYFDYGKALGKKDYAAAARAKAQQLLNHHLYRMSLDAKKHLDKKLQSWRRILSKTDKQIGEARRLDIDYVYAARAILAKHGMGREDYDFASWHRMLSAENPDLAEALSYAIAMHSEEARPYKDMAWADFLALGDAVDNLIEVGKEQRYITVEGKKVEIKEAVARLEDQIKTHKGTGIGTGFAGKISDHDIVKMGLYGVKAKWRRVESWVRMMDGGKYNGPFRELIWNRVSDAANAYYDERKVWMRRIFELLEPHKARLHGEKIVAHELVSDVTGEIYTFEDKGELIGMLMHTGNQSNFDKLLMGMGWDLDSFEAFRDRMYAEGIITKEDMDLVQALWNLAAEMKPAVWRAHKEMYGFRPSEVIAQAFATPFGEYEGGYWPAIADRNKSDDAAARADREAIAKQNNITAFPSTGRGATMSRVEGYAAPLEFSLRLLPSHIDWALRFTHLEPAIKDVGKVLINPDFRDTMGGVDPVVIREMLVPWLQRTARQTLDMPKPGHGWRAINAAAGWLRRQAGLQIMMGNFVNTFQQVTGFGPLAYRTGPRNFAKAWAMLCSDMTGQSERIYQLSAYMRNRQSIIDNNYMARINRVLKRRGPLTGAYVKVANISEDYGYILQHAAQGIVDKIGWIAAYNQALNGEVDGVAAGEDAGAIRYADSVIRETQGSMNPEDVSDIEAQTALGRLFTVFYSFFSAQGNFLLTEGKAIIGDRGAGKVAKAGDLFMLYLMVYMIPSFVADLISASLRGRLPDDDDEDGTALDEWFEFFAISQARYAVAMAPYIREAGGALIGQFTEQRYDDHITMSPALGLADLVIRAPFSVIDAMYNEGDKSTAANEFMTAFGALSGLPVAPLRRPATFAINVAEGDEEPEGMLSTLRGVIGGPGASK